MKYFISKKIDDYLGLIFLLLLAVLFSVGNFLNYRAMKKGTIVHTIVVEVESNCTMKGNRLFVEFKGERFKTEISRNDCIIQKYKIGQTLPFIWDEISHDIFWPDSTKFDYWWVFSLPLWLAALIHIGTSGTFTKPIKSLLSVLVKMQKS